MSNSNQNPFYSIVFDVDREVVAIFQSKHKNLEENKKIIEKNHNHDRGVYSINSPSYETFKNKDLIFETHIIERGLK